MPKIPMFVADLYNIPIYRPTKSTTKFHTKATYETNHTVNRIDVQPLTIQQMQRLEGLIVGIRYQCYIDDTSANIRNGDRVKDPLASVTPSEPDMEVVDYREYPRKDGVPGHIEFYLKSLKG